MNAVDAFFWRGLGDRDDVPAQRVRSSHKAANSSTTSDDVDSFARPSVQRIVPAAGLPLPVTLTATPAPIEQEAPAMANKTEPSTAPATAPAAPPATTPTPTGVQHSTRRNKDTRHTVLLHLAHSPTGLTRNELRHKLGWNVKQVANATYNASRQGLCVADSGGLYSVTAKGKAWLAEKGTPVDDTPAYTRQLAHTPPSFRAAVYSDGGFVISKAGQTIELTATEHAQLLRYLERMAEQTTDPAAG